MAGSKVKVKAKSSVKFLKKGLLVSSGRQQQLWHRKEALSETLRQAMQ